jgi:hydroxymethylpyrimidine pyrophosphatase-like HAD family hydrolase
MHYVALATDYDGTIAHDGAVDDATIAALERLRAGARRLVLVTGRELPDLRRALPRLDLFDLVVAENGALLYRPETREERPLVEPPDPRFVARLRELGVDPLSVGCSIVATWEPNETKVLEAIRELGLELKITFNKGAVMVLPAGVTKASGLEAALDALDLSPLNCVAIGDAENDMAFLDVAGLSVAVANAIPALQERAAWVTEGARGAGVAELIDRLLATDLADLDPQVPRQRIALARREEGEAPLCFVPQREILLLAGVSGGGKSTLTTGLTERLAEAGFQFCVVDPEGDYEGLDHAVATGGADHAPTVDRVVELLRKTDTSAAANLLGVPLADRPVLFATLMSALLALRAQLGRPHFIVVDEAHHMLPADWDPGGAALPEELEGFLFITTRPANVSPRLLGCVDRLLVVGAEPAAALAAFCEARGLPVPPAPEPLAIGEMLVLDARDGTLTRARVIPGAGPRQRHQRKYAEGELGENKSFWFRGPEGKLNLRAQNLTLFMQIADGLDAATWDWHRRRGDYSRWVEEVIKDQDLAGEIAEIETGLSAADEARRLVRDAIECRYTLPG